MANQSFDDYNSAIQFSLALGKVYPRSSVVFSGVLSALVSTVLGFGLALQLGMLESLGGPGLLSSLDGVWTFAVFTVSVAFSVSLSGYLFFGLMAPSDIKATNPQISNPLSYLVTAALLSVLFVVIFLAVSFLGEVVALLGLLIAGGWCAARYGFANYVTCIISSPRVMAIVTFVTLALPVVALVGGVATGSLPSWTYNQWSVALLYGTLAITAVSGPIDMCNNRYEEAISEFAEILSRRDAAERRREELAATAPDRFPIDLPTLPKPENIADAAAMSDELDTVELWLDIYEAYRSQYEVVDEAIEGGVRHQAATGAREQIDTVVATFAEQLHPRHYDDPQVAVEAVDALETVLEGYEHGYVSDTESFDNWEMVDSLLDVAGPTKQQLSRIEDLFEPVRAT